MNTMFKGNLTFNCHNTTWKVKWQISVKQIKRDALKSRYRREVLQASSPVATAQGQGTPTYKQGKRENKQKKKERK